MLICFFIIALLLQRRDDLYFSLLSRTSFSLVATFFVYVHVSSNIGTLSALDDTPCVGFVVRLAPFQKDI